MKTVLVVQGKGGGPKTATVRNIAVAAALSGLKVATLDTDPQGTLSHWHDRRPAEATPILRHEVPLPRISGKPAAIDGVDLLVIDTPTAIEYFPEATAALFDAADLVLVPVRPGPEDLLSQRDTLPYLRSRQRPLLFVLSQAKARTREAREAKAMILGFGDTAPVDIPHLAEVPRSFTLGLGTAEIVGSRTGPLFTQLWTHIADRIGGAA